MAEETEVYRASWRLLTLLAQGLQNDPEDKMVNPFPILMVTI